MDGAGCGRLVAVGSGTTVESESRLCQVRETPDFTVVTRQSQKQGFSTQASLSQTSKCGLLSDLEEVDIDRKLFPPTMVRGKDELE